MSLQLLAPIEVSRGRARAITSVVLPELIRSFHAGGAKRSLAGPAGSSKSGLPNDTFG